MFICGTSGGGKSVALKTLTARNIATTGCGAFFIDVEGEYTELTKMLGGKVIKIKNGQATGINIFDIEAENGEININDKVSEISSLLATICRNRESRNLDGDESAEIETIVKELYEERRYNK